MGIRFLPWLFDHLKNRTEEFYLEKKEKLKEANDWNKPLDETKYVSYSITDHKVLGKIYTPLAKKNVMKY